MLAAVSAQETASRTGRSQRAPEPAAAPPTLRDLTTVVERDRRAGIERIIELGRWIALVFAAVTNNFPGSEQHRVGDVNLILGAWALFNLAVTIALLARHLPGPRLQYGMTGLDVTIATTLVYLTGGYSSSFALTFYVVVIATSLRYGLAGSMLCATVCSALYLAAGAIVAGGIPASVIDVYGSRLFLFYVVALTSGLLARELVTARARQMERTFNLEHAAFLELREVDRLKSDFVMLASHELRTPLAKIKAWLMLVQDAGDRLPDAGRREAMEVLREESEQLARLTDNLLCIAQLEAGEIRLHTAPVDLSETVQQVFARFVEAADQRRFLCDIPEEARQVFADHERLSLVLACLVDNALKFSAKDEPVLIRAERARHLVRIEVHDNGRRIPDDQLERVFASFYQLEQPLTRQRGGCGVGLYLARQLVERMGGRIWVDNANTRRGNTFVLMLPAGG